MRSIILAQLLILVPVTASCNSRSAAPQRSASDSGRLEAQLPPAIVDGHIYRCADNSVVSIDYFQGDRGALLGVDGGKQLIALTAPDKGGNLSAGGYIVVGRGAAIWFQRPGGALQRCKT